MDCLGGVGGGSKKKSARHATNSGGGKDSALKACGGVGGVPGEVEKGLEIRNGEHGVDVVGAVRCAVESMEDVAAILARGWSQRKMRETRYHDASSRSHMVLRCTVVHSLTRQEKNDSKDGRGSTVVVRRGTLHLVDLAGSERWESDGAATGMAGNGVARGVGISAERERDEMAKINRCA